jgi:hypothetical protein
MKRTIRIFKSMEEQEKFHKQVMLESTVAERFQKLYQMQQTTKLLHPVANTPRKIQIRKWTSYLEYI